MNRLLEIHYGGAILSLEISTPAAVTLRINGLVRDSTSSHAANPTLRVSSTVQTDYEWHEFIEGIVCWRDDEITAHLLANNRELVSRCYSSKETA